MELSTDEELEKAEEPKPGPIPSEAYIAGADLRTDVFKCLLDIRKYEIKLLQRNRQTQLKEFERRMGELYRRFVLYDNEAAAGSIKMLSGNPKLGTVVFRGVFAAQLDSQREMIRMLLRDCDNSLSNHQNRANNLTATTIAIFALVASVLLGLFSLIVSFLQLYLSLDTIVPINPVRY